MTSFCNRLVVNLLIEGIFSNTDQNDFGLIQGIRSTAVLTATKHARRLCSNPV